MIGSDRSSAKEDNMNKFIIAVVVSTLSTGLMAHPQGKPYTVHSVDPVRSTVVLNGSLVADEYVAALGDKTVITINDKQWSRSVVRLPVGPIVQKYQVSEGVCISIKDYMNATFPVGKEVQPVFEVLAQAQEIGTVYGPKSMGDILVDGKSVREQLSKFAAAAKCQ